jgi:hypothetical protein
MNSGFVQLHRQILQWEWYQNPNVKMLFIHCLLKANHKDKKWQGILVHRGSFITSHATLAKELGLSVKKIRTALNHLISTGEVAKHSNNLHTVITINNYDLFQSRASQQASKGQAKGKQRATTNNDNNDNNENKDTRPAVRPIDLYIEKFNSSFSREFRVTEGRARKLRVRLKTYKLELILKALDNMSANKFYHGDNDKNWSADPDFLIRSDEQIDKFLNKAPEKSNEGSGREVAYVKPDGEVIYK